MTQGFGQTLLFTSYLDYNNFEYFFFPTFGDLLITEEMEQDLECLVVEKTYVLITTSFDIEDVRDIFNTELYPRYVCKKFY